MCIMCKRERERERERVRRLTYQKDRILLHEKPHSNTFPLNMDNKEREKPITMFWECFLIDEFKEFDAIYGDGGRM